jgi:hypothetical protein
LNPPSNGTFASAPRPLHGQHGLPTCTAAMLERVAVACVCTYTGVCECTGWWWCRCASCCYVPPTRRFPDECVFTANHTVYVYRTTDLAQWELLGAALTPGDRPPGIEFRPHVVYNPGTTLFVMWFENRPSAIVSKGYTIATSPSPEGPFTVVRTEVAVADTPGMCRLHAPVLKKALVRYISFGMSSRALVHSCSQTPPCPAT